METKKNYLILTVITGILCVPALGEVELPLRHRDPLLIGQSNSALAGIDKLYVWIVPLGFESNSHGLVFKKLENLVADRLKEAGITVTETDIGKMVSDSSKMLEILKRRIVSAENLKFRPFRIPELRVDIDTLDVEHSQQVVFRIQTSLSRAACLKEQSSLLFKADVWKTMPVMQAASVQNMPAIVTGVVMEQVEAFMHACVAANPSGKGSSDTRTSGTDSLTAAEKQTKPVDKSAVAEYKYVASKNSKIFHKSDCSWAKRIKPGNLVGYNSRDEAIKAGKRPCKQCKP